MRSRHVKMSLEDYAHLAFRPAWKQEYFDGCLVETPREVFVHATTPVAQRPQESPAPLRPVTSHDEPALHRCFCQAFLDTIEFCDYASHQLDEAARNCLRRFFGTAGGDALDASRVALGAPGTPEANRPIGAVLVLKPDIGWALLDMIFVTPRWQRGGLGTALAAAGVNALYQQGGTHTMVSRYHLGNDASRAWHHRFGFVDCPDLQVARLRRRAAIDARERGHWEREVARLEALVEAGLTAEADPWEKWRRKSRAEGASRPQMAS